MSSLRSATLTLTLIPNGDVWTDIIRIGSLEATRFSELRELQKEIKENPDLELGTIQLNLLEKFTPAQIINEIRSSEGVLSMEYEEDAMVQYAHIELEP